MVQLPIGELTGNGENTHHPSIYTRSDNCKTTPDGRFSLRGSHISESSKDSRMVTVTVIPDNVVGVEYPSRDDPGMDLCPIVVARMYCEATLLSVVNSLLILSHNGCNCLMDRKGLPLPIQYIV